MTNSLSLPLDGAAASLEASAPARTVRRACLSAVAIDVPVKVVALELDGETGAWLRAVGIGEGEQLTVLRRAAFGGPIHVRASSGGEFAIHRALAKAIVIRGDEESAA
jgi:ferrous iron transport protein A